MTSKGRSDALILKITPDGKVLWSKHFGGKDNDLASRIVMDAFGNIYTTGWFWFDAVMGNDTLTSKGKRDVFLSKLSPRGEFIWSKGFGSKEKDSVKGIVVGDTVSIVGTFHYQIDFGGKPLLQSGDTDSVAPKSDVFVATFSP